jgi:hypothetical protein
MKELQYYKDPTWLSLEKKIIRLIKTRQYHDDQQILQQLIILLETNFPLASELEYDLNDTFTRIIIKLRK